MNKIKYLVLLSLILVSCLDKEDNIKQSKEYVEITTTAIIKDDMNYLIITKSYNGYTDVKNPLFVVNLTLDKKKLELIDKQLKEKNNGKQ